MRTHRTLLPALLGGLAIVLAACGQAGSPAPGATATPGTAAPTATPGGGLPTFALPSLSTDPDLEALLPDEIAGQEVQTFSMTGDSFLGTGGSGAEELQALLGGFGKTASDLSVAFGGAGDVGIIAYRVDGVPANLLFQAFLTAAQQESNATVSDVSLGGKAVKRVVSSDGDLGTAYVYASGDVMFIVGGEDTSDALLNETFSKLP